jgi:hypothetical protein
VSAARLRALAREPLRRPAGPRGAITFTIPASVLAGAGLPALRLTGWLTGTPDELTGAIRARLG